MAESGDEDCRNELLCAARGAHLRHLLGVRLTNVLLLVILRELLVVHREFLNLLRVAGFGAGCGVGYRWRSRVTRITEMSFFVPRVVRTYAIFWAVVFSVPVFAPQ